MYTKGGGKDVKTARALLKALNGLYSLVLALMLMAAAGFSGYVLWDGSQVIRSTHAVQQSVQAYRPAAGTEGTAGTEGAAGAGKKASFAELQALNPDICAWLILPNTGIDDPVVQGKINGEYLSKNVYGNYDLAGSIFLDTRNSRSFDGTYQVLYGHNVDNGAMFADLLKYRDGDFFEKSREGTLILPEGGRKLHIFACFQASTWEPLIFDPIYAAENRALLLDFAGEHAEQANGEALNALRSEGGKILAMTTCTNGSDQDARTVVLAWMEETA